MGARGTRMPLVRWERRERDPEVLFVTSSWPFPGNPTYGIFIERQVASLVQAGLRCDVLFVRGYRSPLAYLSAALYLTALTLAPRRRYRLVHAHGGEAGVAAWFYRRAPLVVSYCGDDLLGTARADGSITRLSRVKSAFLRRHARLARATITKSEQMAAVLSRTPRLRSTVIPNGVDVERFRPMPRAEARAELGWPADERVVLFAASPSIGVKRHWLAEAACELAAARLPGVDVRLRVAENVPGDRMPLLMNAADCLLLPSVSEGSPNAVKEALMCNLPVVATPVGDVEHVLRDVSPSAVCAPTPEALAEGLLACLEPPRRSNGRAVSAWLAAPAIAARILAKYAEVCGSPVARSAPVRPVPAAVQAGPEEAAG